MSESECFCCIEPVGGRETCRHRTLCLLDLGGLTLSDTDDDMPGVDAGRLELRSKPRPLPDRNGGMLSPKRFLYLLANNCLSVYYSESAAEDMKMHEPEPVISLPSAGGYISLRATSVIINFTYSSRNTRIVPEPHHDRRGLVQLPVRTPPRVRGPRYQC
jgi:hypothetical protein